MALSHTVKVAEELAGPVAEGLGLRLWDVRFEKEGSIWYLRYIIDKDGGIDITDCEKFSRMIDPILDKADPIEQSYTLEVSSPGIERELTREWHYDACIGKPVTARLIRPQDGIKELQGILKGYSDGLIIIDDSQINKNNLAFVKLVDDYDYDEGEGEE